MDVCVIQRLQERKMYQKINEYQVAEETLLKALILTRGVIFSKEAIQIAAKECAKRQNAVYNIPMDSSLNRPQELMLRNKIDAYDVVVSCVSPHVNANPVHIDCTDSKHLTAVVDGCDFSNVEIHFVKEPAYYSMFLKNGERVSSFVSACGMDELNVIPWKGCAISKKCAFCGANSLVRIEDISAHSFSKNANLWEMCKDSYLNNLDEAIHIASNDSCYDEHMHVIMIAGNLRNDLLDLEADIFAEISKRICSVQCIKDKMDGPILVISPPHDSCKLYALKKAGVQKIVFNFEAVTRKGFEKYCPGKNILGYNHFFNSLKQSVNIFGKGNVWTNLVFGLENKEDVLNECREIISNDIVVGANILHLDQGNTLDCDVPSMEDSIDFFYRMQKLNEKMGYRPFYCSKALRTSLSNEVSDSRILVD